MLLVLLLVFQHHWTPPKGHLDQLSSGEWEEELVAALRETEEEAGIGKNHLQVCTTATSKNGTCVRQNFFLESTS